MRDDYYQEVASRFMEDSGLDQNMCKVILSTYLDQAKALIGDFEAAYVAGDMVEAANIIHRLKGSSGNVRVNEIMSISLALEKRIKAGEPIDIEEAISHLSAYVEGLSKGLVNS